VIGGVACPVEDVVVEPVEEPVFVFGDPLPPEFCDCDPEPVAVWPVPLDPVCVVPPVDDVCDCDPVSESESVVVWPLPVDPVCLVTPVDDCDCDPELEPVVVWPVPVEPV
jgi:hypothetical protein